jgi:hypothetical protein
MPSLNILQDNKTQCTQIFAELSIVRNKLKSRIEHKYFGTNISQSLSNLGIDERKNFEKVTLNCYERSLKYLEKWFAFENNIFQKLDVLNLNSVINYKSIFDIVDTLKINLDKDMLFDEIILLNEFLEKKEFNSNLDHLQKWIEFINICKAPNIEIILEIVFSIYSSNAYVERVFSIINNVVHRLRLQARLKGTFGALGSGSMVFEPRLGRLRLRLAGFESRLRQAQGSAY